MQEKMFSLGARLEACASFVRRGKTVADIGTDHAYLPIWLIQNGIVPIAFASDINEEPIKTAQKNIEEFGLSEKIKTFTSDGLVRIPPREVDDIVIAGMGGDNIAAILNGVNWLSDERYRLILQPMTRASVLREYLFATGFDIIEEKAVCEGKRLYTIAYAKYSEKQNDFTEFDIYAGKLDSRDATAAALLLKQASILRAAAKGCNAEGNTGRGGELLALADQLEAYANGRKQE